MKARYVLLYGLLLWLLAVCLSCTHNIYEEEHVCIHERIIRIEIQYRYDWETRQMKEQWVAIYQYKGLPFPVDISDTVGYKVGELHDITPKK